MRRPRVSTLLLLGLLLLSAAEANAGLTWTCPHDGQTFQFAPDDTAHRQAFAERHLAMHESSSGSGGSVTGSGSTGDPFVDAMMPVLEQSFQQLGQEVARALFPDPAEQQRLAAIRRQEMELLAEQERLRRAEQERVERELHQKLLSEMIRLDEPGALPFLGIDQADDAVDAKPAPRREPIALLGADESLEPGGTAFFGTGGGPGSEAKGDAAVVDLRDLRRAAYVVQLATRAEPGEAATLMDEALGVAQGGSAFIAIDESAAPVVDGAGLRAFQESNAAYRKARDSRMVLSDRFAVIDSRYRAAEGAYQRAQAELERAQDGDEAARAKQRALLADVLEKLRALDAERRNARARLGAAETDVAWRDGARRRSLEEVVVPAPALLPGVLAEEHARLQPSIPERVAHAGRKRASALFAGALDEYIQEHYGFVDDPVQQARLDRLVARLRALSPYPDEPSRVRIIGRPRFPDKERGKERNAFATSDVIYFGIDYLRTEPSDDALLFVAAHEICHSQRDHYAGSLQRAIGVEAFVGTGSLVDAERSTLSEWDQKQIRTAVYQGWHRDFSHEQELEADRLGAYLALSAGAKPNGIRETFEWIESLHSEPPTNAERRRVEALASHPHADVRMGKLRELYGFAIDRAPSAKR